MEMTVEEMEEYIKRGFRIFSVRLRYDNAKQKKDILPPKGYNEFKWDDYYYEETFTGIGVRTGIEYEKDKYLILIDIDKKEEGDKRKGEELWEKMPEEREDTVKEETPNGKHYYYYVTGEEKKNIGNEKTVLEYEGKRYSIDYKFTNQFAIIAGSYYYKNGKRCDYKSIGGTLITGKIRHIPKELYEIVKANSRKRIERKSTTFRNARDDEIEEEKDKEDERRGDIIRYDKEEIRKYLRYIGKKDEYERWRNVGYVIKSLNSDAIDVYKEWSKGSNKYNEVELERYWKYHKINEGIRIDALKGYVRCDRMEGYENVIEERREKRKYEAKQIQERYLTNKKMEIGESLRGEIEEWYKRGKYLAIKSPYDTGKTTLIKAIMDKYGTDTILYVTYRQTLSLNVESTFSEYGFVNYMKKEYAGERQIIQLDSIDKLIEIRYKLVIIDEIESVLAHLTGETITKKGYMNGEHIYEQLKGRIEEADKVLVMDGDYGNRAHTFLSEFGQEVKVIENVTKTGNKIIREYKNEQEFKKKIYEDLDNNKKIVICCMSANRVDEYYELITTQYKWKEVKKYTSKTDDEKKEELMDVEENWNIDVLLYSPTIEAGVNYDVEHYDKLYVIYSGKSTCPRGLNQMMNRVRKFKDNEVGILMIHATKCENGVMRMKEIRENYKCITRKKELNGYDIIKCYNELERIESNRNFMGVFMRQIREKGYEYIPCEGEVKEDDKVNMMRNKIIAAKDITEERYMELKEKQKRNELKEGEKYELEKAIYKRKYGLSEVPEEFLKKYYKKLGLIDKHINLIDERNIKYYNEKEKNYDLEREIKETRIVKEMIKAKGYEHCYDDKKISKEEMEKKMGEVTALKREYYRTRNAKCKKEDTFKKQIGGINKILHEYGIQLKNIKKKIRENGKICNKYEYMLERMNKIDEYVGNKINNGMVIKDKNKIFMNNNIILEE